MCLLYSIVNTGNICVCTVVYLRFEQPIGRVLLSAILLKQSYNYYIFFEVLEISRFIFQNQQPFLVITAWFILRMHGGSGLQALGKRGNVLSRPNQSRQLQSCYPMCWGWGGLTEPTMSRTLKWTSNLDGNVGNCPRGRNTTCYKNVWVLDRES